MKGAEFGAVSAHAVLLFVADPHAVVQGQKGQAAVRASAGFGQRGVA
ncbi:MAG: hypothetical protein AAF245_10650 [Pseudomonadota bacterium]